MAVTQWLTAFWISALHNHECNAMAILTQAGMLGFDGAVMRAIKNAVKRIANSLSIAKMAPTEAI